jgi:hypothetical protein
MVAVDDFPPTTEAGDRLNDEISAARIAAGDQVNIEAMSANRSARCFMRGVSRGPGPVQERYMSVRTIRTVKRILRSPEVRWHSPAGVNLKSTEVKLLARRYSD